MDSIIMDDHSKAQPRKIPLEADWINRFLVLSLSEEEMRAILSKLGCQFDGDLVIVPPISPIWFIKRTLPRKSRGLWV